MEKKITWETRRRFAYVNDRLCPDVVRGLVLEFPGLGGMAMYEDETEPGRYYAERGILFAIPYNNPWSWMNRQAVGYTDEVVAILTARYGEKGKLPLVATGGSMGGQSALVYTRYAAQTPCACVVNCPVCDLPYHYTERPDLPRTLYSAFYHEPGSLTEAMEKASPLHLALAGQMPDIPYSVFHCEADRAVDIDRHSARFVGELRRRGYTVMYETVPDRGHCDLTEEAAARYRAAVCDAIAQTTGTL